jgi:hypothetical protein
VGAAGPGGPTLGIGAGGKQLQLLPPKRVLP